MSASFKIGGHRGMGCTDHDFYQAVRDVANLPVENTIESVIAAFKSGADYVEIDAVMSEDGALFALHNVVPKDHFFGIDRSPPLLNNMNFFDIEKYKSGRYQKGQIATLIEIMEYVAALDPRTLPWAVNIEIKGVQGSGQDYEANDYLKNLAQEIRQSSLDSMRILFSSFSLQNIIQMSHLLPQAQYGMLFADKGQERPIYADHQDDFRFRYLQFDEASVENMYHIWNTEAHSDTNLSYVHPEILTITENMIDLIGQKDMGVNCWALFEKFDASRADIYKKTMTAAAQKGVPFTVITDYIPEMKALKLEGFAGAGGAR